MGFKGGLQAGAAFFFDRVLQSAASHFALKLRFICCSAPSAGAGNLFRGRELRRLPLEADALLAFGTFKDEVVSVVHILRLAEIGSETRKNNPSAANRVLTVATAVSFSEDPFAVGYSALKFGRRCGHWGLSADFD